MAFKKPKNKTLITFFALLATVSLLVGGVVFYANLPYMHASELLTQEYGRVGVAYPEASSAYYPGARCLDECPSLDKVFAPEYGSNGDVSKKVFDAFVAAGYFDVSSKNKFSYYDKIGSSHIVMTGPEGKYTYSVYIDLLDDGHIKTMLYFNPIENKRSKIYVTDPSGKTTVTDPYQR